MLRRICLGFSACAFALLLQSGCALRHWDITLSNGAVIGAKGKPRNENGYWVFTDMQGQPQALAESRVSEIAPHVDKKKKSPFNNYSATPR